MISEFERPLLCKPRSIEELPVFSDSVSGRGRYIKRTIPLHGMKNKGRSYRKKKKKRPIGRASGALIPKEASYPGRSNQNLSEIKFPGASCLPPKVATEPKTGIEAASSIGRYVIAQVKGKRPHTTQLTLF